MFVDRYRVLRRLGTGGSATVWLAEDERLGREVAIKRLKTDAPEESLRRFRREARLGATLNHPNFVSVYDTVAVDDCALIVMEYVPGQSLEGLAKSGPVDPDRAISILRGAAGAIDHAHAAGVVHRDIKPANILLREDGTVKVADLGIARAVDATQITAEGKVIGTAAYMAPERFAAAGTGRPESDIYSLSAVAYELLSGASLEVEAGHAPDRMAMAERWPDAPSAAFAVIMRGLSPDPARRPRSAVAFVDELDEALKRGEQETQPVTGPFVPPLPERRPQWAPGMTRRAPRRSRTGAALALTLIALAGIAVAGIALGGGSGGDGTTGGGAKKEAKTAKKTGGSSGKSSQGASGEAVASAPAVAAPAPAEPSGSSSADGAALNSQGFELINQGRPDQAVPILRRAVASFPEGTTDLNYAYALYNLGNALRLSGHPDQAIPVLERRLEIPDQTSTVAAELARARAEAATH
jgi:tetratricopeptide (TPR) repeat protein/predicted Ser/Thr protein kinase